MKGVTTWGLSQRRARWKCNSGKDAGYLRQDEKTPEALLQFGIVLGVWIRSVVGRIWSPDFGQGGSANETPTFKMLCTNFCYPRREKSQEGGYKMFSRHTMVFFTIFGPFLLCVIFGFASYFFSGPLSSSRVIQILSASLLWGVFWSWRISILDKQTKREFQM